MQQVTHFLNPDTIHKLILLAVEAITALSKLYLLIRVFSIFQQTSNKTKLLWGLVCLIIFCSVLDDTSWIIKLTRRIFFPLTTPNFTQLWLRFAWITCSIQYFSLSLLIEKMVTKPFILSPRHYITGFLCAILTLLLTGIAIFQYYHIAAEERVFEIFLYKVVHFYVFLAMIPAVLITIKKIRTTSLPRILNHQSKILILFFFIPHLFFVALSANPFQFDHGIYTNNYIFIAFNNIILTIALYFCAKKMIGLRFLNIKNHVQSAHKYNFINDFKTVLEQLSHVTTEQELQHITKAFFQHAFSIPQEYTQLFIRSQDPQEPVEGTYVNSSTLFTTSSIEHILINQTTENITLSNYIARSGIVIKDEIEFDYFYDQEIQQKALVHLLNTITASIFLPLYDKHTVVAYIIIHANARPDRLFSNIERDEMLVFSSYLSTLIYLLRHRNLEALVRQDKDLKDELYAKHQEIQHYKESIRTLLKTNTTQKIGIVYYKNKSLLYGNSAAQELFGKITSPEFENNYGLVLKKLAYDVKKYNAERKLTIQDQLGNPLILCAQPSVDRSSILIFAFYPDIADTFTIPFDALKDLSSWDYAICLETTKSGQLINQLIPSSSEALLNFKINLLKIALNKKATLLELPDEDIVPIANLLHHISLRTTLHTMTLDKNEKDHIYALQLFGTTALFDIPAREGLFDKLSNTGTIFLQNIEFLSLETQTKLYQYLISGAYQPVRSDKKINSHVRIISSTSANLEALVRNGTFSLELLNELKKASLSMPSLLTIPHNELISLAQRFSEQAIKTKELQNLIQLNEKETDKIIHQAPSSIYEFKKRIHTALVHKSARKKINNLLEFNPSYLNNDPEVAQALSLGKHTLKDKHLMNVLWNKFKNQRKIATLLNVNRSSVNRRCKQFKIVMENESA